MSVLIRILVLLFIALPASAQWQIGQRSFAPVGGGATGSFGAQDIWTNFTVGTGNITAVNMAAGTAGTSNCTWTRNGTAASLTVGTSQTTLPYSVGPVAAVTYPPATTTQSMAISDTDNTSLPTAICTLTTTVPIATWSAYLTLNMLTAPTSNNLFDRHVFTGSVGTNFATAQIQIGQQCMANGGYGINIETSPGGVTTHSACIPLAPGGKYWVTMKADFTAGLASLKVYNPANFALIGSLTGAMTASGNIISYRDGQNEIGISSGTTSYIEDAMVDFTNHVFPVVPVSPPAAPTYAGQGVANSSTASGTTITAVRVPASTANGLAVFACTTAATGTITITDSQSNTYTQNTAPTVVNGYRCAISTRFGLASTASDTITATFGTTSTKRIIHVEEFSGGTAVDQTTGIVNATSTTGGAFTSASFTPTAQPELALGFFVGPNGTYTRTGSAPLSTETIQDSLGVGALLTATSSTSLAGVDENGSSGVAITTAAVTIK